MMERIGGDGISIVEKEPSRRTRERVTTCGYSKNDRLEWGND